ncbi:hypothetical protein CBS101457_006929 [Exobasidium rhododendri]|nr:hypothetical protein CBS101457_006929 [Exobasidium rhododendri]
MKILTVTFLLATCAVFATASLASGGFEDFDGSLQGRGDTALKWHQRDLEARQNSVPPTTTTTTTAPTSTGTLTLGTGCQRDVQCTTGNCYNGRCRDPAGLGSTQCLRDAACESGNCVAGNAWPRLILARPATRTTAALQERASTANAQATRQSRLETSALRVFNVRAPAPSANEHTVANRKRVVVRATRTWDVQAANVFVDDVLPEACVRACVYKLP